MTKYIKNNLIYIFFMAIAVTVLFWKLFNGYIPIPYKMDYVRFLTQQIRTITDIQNGFFPLWNPYILCGVPAIALATSNMFSPMILIYFLFADKVFAYGFLIFFEVFCTGLTFYFMMRTIFKTTRLASFIAGISFCMCGFMFWNGNIPMQNILNLMFVYPLVFLFYYKLRESGKPVFAFLMSICLVLSFLNCNGGILHHGYDIVFLTLFHLSFLIFKPQPLKKELKLNIIYFISIALSLGLCAFQLLPVYEVVQNSTRFTGAVYYTPEKIFPTIFSFVYPDIWPTIQSGQIQFLRSLQYGVVGYCGVASTILAVAGALFCKDKKRFFFVLYPLLYFPAWIVYSNASIVKILPLFLRAGNHLFYSFYLYAFCVAVLAGLGFNFIYENKFSVKDKIAILICKLISYGYIVIYLVFFTGLIILALKFDYITGFIKSVFLDKVSTVDTLSQSTVFYTDKLNFLFSTLWSNIPLFLASNFVKIFALVILIALFFNKRKKIFFPTLAVLICLDFILIGYQHLEWKPRDYYFPETKEIQFLKKDNSVYRVGIFYEDSNWFWEQNPDAGFHDFNKFTYDRSHKLHENIIIHFGIEKIGAFSGLCPYRRYQYFELLDQKFGFCSHGIFLTGFESPLLDLLNMKYVLYPKDYELNIPKLENVFTGDHYSVYLNKNVIPRTFFVEKAEFIESQNDLFDLMKNKNFDFSKQVLLSEKKPPEEYLDTPSTNTNAEVTIEGSNPNGMNLKVKTGSSGWIVIGNAYHDGWKAFVDGKETPVYPAYHLLQALHVEKGEHDIVLEFFPQKMKTGGYVAGISLILFLLIIFVPFFLKKK